MHDLWVYSLTQFGNCGVDEVTAVDGGSSVESVVWPWINVVLFDALPLLVASGLVVPLAVAARRYRRSSPIFIFGRGGGGGGYDGADPMAMIHAALATLVVYVVCVLPASVFHLAVYYRPPLFADPRAQVAFLSALTVVQLIRCVHSGTVYVAFFVATASMRAAVRTMLHSGVRRITAAVVRTAAADTRVQTAAAVDARRGELEMLDIGRPG